MPNISLALFYDRVAEALVNIDNEKGLLTHNLYTWASISLNSCMWWLRL